MSQGFTHMSDLSERSHATGESLLRTIEPRVWASVYVIFTSATQTYHDPVDELRPNLIEPGHDHALEEANQRAADRNSAGSDTCNVREVSLWDGSGPGAATRVSIGISSKPRSS
eukprot:gene20089-26811_t